MLNYHKTLHKKQNKIIKKLTNLNLVHLTGLELKSETKCEKHTLKSKFFNFNLQIV